MPSSSASKSLRTSLSRARGLLRASPELMSPVVEAMDGAPEGQAIEKAVKTKNSQYYARAAALGLVCLMAITGCSEEDPAQKEIAAACEAVRNNDGWAEVDESKCQKTVHHHGGVVPYYYYYYGHGGTYRYYGHNSNAGWGSALKGSGGSVDGAVRPKLGLGAQDYTSLKTRVAGVRGGPAVDGPGFRAGMSQGLGRVSGMRKGAPTRTSAFRGVSRGGVGS